MGKNDKTQIIILYETMYQFMISKDTDNLAKMFSEEFELHHMCGICAKVCPADNIAVTDKVTFFGHWEVCYACLHNCPQNAIHMKAEKSVVRFRNEHVSLQDIIQANE